MIRALPRLELELHAARPAGKWAAWALLALALALIVDLGISYQSAREEVAASTSV